MNNFNCLYNFRSTFNNVEPGERQTLTLLTLSILECLDSRYARKISEPFKSRVIGISQQRQLMAQDRRIIEQFQNYLLLEDLTEKE